MKIKTTMLYAILALSAGIGAGFSSTSYAVDPVCRGDCGDVRQGCYANCQATGGSTQCYVNCQNKYQACLRACP